MTREDITGAVARGWTHPANEHKVMDEELAFAIIEEVWQADTTPNLGYATTQQLIEELHARADVAATIGEAWPAYRTVDAAAPERSVG